VIPPFFFAAFVNATQNLERYFDPQGCQLYTPKNIPLKAAPGLEADQLIIACTEFSKMEISVSSLYSESELSSDPFIHCPACATTLRTKLNDGEFFSTYVILEQCLDDKVMQYIHLQWKLLLAAL
jgi:hypothetical protein